MTRAVVAAVLLGQLAGEEIEVGLSQDLLEAAPQLRAEPLVGEGEPAVEVLAEDHLGEGLDQRVIEDLRLAEGPDRAAPLVGHGLEVGGEDGVPLPQPPERDPGAGHDGHQDEREGGDPERLPHPTGGEHELQR